MPTLQEISEQAAAAAEKTIRDSMAMDYAYLADVRDFEGNQRPHRLRDFIERQYQELMRDVSGDSGSGGPDSQPG